jgi:hypothetical protein
LRRDAVLIDNDCVELFLDTASPEEPRERLHSEVYLLRSIRVQSWCLMTLPDGVRGSESRNSTICGTA